MTSLPATFSGEVALRWWRASAVWVFAGGTATATATLPPVLAGAEATAAGAALAVDAAGFVAAGFVAAGAFVAWGRDVAAPFATAGFDAGTGFLAGAAFTAAFDFAAGFARAAGFTGLALAAALGLALALALGLGLGFALAPPFTLESTAASSFFTVPSGLPRFVAAFAAGFLALAAGLDAVFFFAAGLPFAAAFAGFAAAPRLFVFAPFAMLLDILYRRFGRSFLAPSRAGCGREAACYSVRPRMQQLVAPASSARLVPIPPRQPLIAAIRAYQRAVSPWLGQRCRFHPSCSSYAIEAMERFGGARGSVLALFRVVRCNPLCEGGLDPVPDIFPRRPWRRTAPVQAPDKDEVER